MKTIIPKALKKFFALAGLLLVGATSATAGTGDSKKVITAPEQQLFRADEVDLDAFVGGAAGNFNHKQYTGVGGGLGATYFFTRCWGIGIDDTLGSLNGNGATYDNLQGNLIARLPMESLHLAPYAIAGGGATWGNHNAQGNGNVGCGIEYRFNPSIGLFVDSRYIYGNQGLNENLSRAGIRLAF
jgi:hypothetical protein